MKSIDIMKTENGFNIITNGGGSLLLNGEEILTLDSYLDKVYPKEIEFVFPSGFNPGEKIGGDWTCVAQDIVMPLGNSAPVSLSKAGGFVLESKDASKNMYITAGNGTLSYWTGSTFGSGENLYYGGGISATANLASATKTKPVSIWKRT